MHRLLPATQPVVPVKELWRSSDPAVWDNALKRYWDYVQPRNLEVERALDNLDLNRIRMFDADEWYHFLHDEYFRWKYTAANRLVTTTRQLERYVEEERIDELDQVWQRLLSLKASDIRQCLKTACGIKGLGIAGASGLLSVMYPAEFATVDQFVVKALRETDVVETAGDLSNMNPMSLTISDGVLLIGLLRDKARDNNRAFGTTSWSPRLVDKVLWTYGR
jgi:hypothetical protein